MLIHSEPQRSSYSIKAPMFFFTGRRQNELDAAE